MSSFSNGWIHASGVWAFRKGGPRIVSTVVMGDPLHLNATQVINTATNFDTSPAVSLQRTQNKDGSRPLAAEISMLGVRNPTDKAGIVYDDSGSDFYRGLKDVIWNMDNNTIISGAVLQQGSFTPDPGFDESRWVDFIDAIAPVRKPADHRRRLGCRPVGVESATLNLLGPHYPMSQMRPRPRDKATSSRALARFDKIPARL
jgi:hypothetical protein